MACLAEVVVFLGISLDGFIAGPDGDLSWMAECASESPTETGYDALMRQAGALVLGRRTYDAVLRFSEWPFGGRPVYVMTNRPLEPQHGERALRGNLDEALLSVERAGATCIYLDGGDVVRQALAINRVDRLVLSWLPVVLGDGVRLFARGMPSSRWRLLHSRAFASGMVQASYGRTDRVAVQVGQPQGG